MNASAVTGRLYPVALALANIGVGVGLYLIGALFFALLLWICGGLVLTATASRGDYGPAQSGIVAE
ncbi:MAG: hypothetical protein V5A39_05300 [Haloarculaceae archaeon]